ncbi:MFS transporter [Taklimakanibacter deserti]|uniref:MFS transporter n=1 Tax=Taklimakanibacter deserti TaxID=2267839 RepID=UPI0013C47E28
MALTAVAAMSQAFRTVATVIAGGLKADFAASDQDISLVAAAFHLAFALAQFPIGVALDIYGPRRTVSAAFLIAVLGALLSSLAPSLPLLMAGQFLIGIGCAPAFLGTIVFITNRYPRDHFARLSGLVLALSGIGMLATGTPLAWIVEHGSWRLGFLVLAACAALVLVAVFRLVSNEAPQRRQERETLWQAFGKIGPILVEQHTLGILALGAAAYSAFISLRGLWAVPMLMDRHGFTLIESGHVMLAVSIATILGPPLFGLLAVTDRMRRFWIIGTAILYVLVFLALAFSGQAIIDVLLAILAGILTGFTVLQYADVRAAYSDEVAGRALAVFTMAVFLGIALMQWLTGLAASLATASGTDPLLTAFLVIAGLLAAATAGFTFLPWPRFRR